MADATLPTAGTYYPGHVPFHLRVRKAQLNETPRIVRLLRLEGQLVTVLDGDDTQVLWTHEPAVRLLSQCVELGYDQLSRYGRDIFIIKGCALSLVDPEQASLCEEPDTCGHGRVISVRTGKPWDTEDTLAQIADAGDDSDSNLP
ncbi:hypothetical protein ACNI3K_09475 [Demequina sp. SO4-13]|uniref:hypothetical protein n=1 Tax=Demequina sp. SO4-13 TaxID=3401027 RepID=UPI003AF42042